jgi:hypothetical protein
MFYFLFVEPGPLGALPAANVFRYISSRTAWGMLTALVLAYALFPWFIEWLKKKRIDQIIRTDGPESHLLQKGGTPTMGGLVMLVSVLVSTLLWGRLDIPQTWLVLVVMCGYGLIGFVDDWKKVMDRVPDGPRGPLEDRRPGGLRRWPRACTRSSAGWRRTRRCRCRSLRGHVIDFSALWEGAPWQLGCCGWRWAVRARRPCPTP